MDTRSWRKVLLQWIGKCQFIEPNYISLEQSDLDSFFSVFIRKIQETQSDKGKELQDQPTKPIPLVQEFLAHNYPEFIVHQDDKEQPLDCLYVYTLLLHYSCVKKPSLFFHNICNNLPEMTQTCIASFFGETVDRLLTREYLSQSIANVAIIYQQGTQTSVSPCLPSSSLSPDPRSDDAQCPSTPSSSSSQPSSSTPQLHNHRERLRLQMSGSEMPPPSTPKTELLEQRTKELRGIRAQLEVVRYEKTVLEEQQLEKDELIKVLSKEKMMAKMELERLKNVKLNEEPHDNESHIMPYEFEHMKGNLLKEIGLKENLITEITDKLHDLRVEKSELSEKLNLAGKQLLEYTDRIRLLESRVEELTRSVSSRDDRIFFLELDNQELDQCLKEARDELKNRREVLNASSDLLDCSLSPNTTPENLASSVIDKQLREKEHENAELKEKLQYLHTSQRELCQALSSFLQKHNIDHEFPVEWTSSSLLSTISAIESTFVNTVEKSTQMKKECDVQAVCVEKLLEKCKLLYRSLGCQPQELDAFKATIAEPMESVFESSRECETILGCCHMRVVDIALKNNHLELDNERLNENCAELKSIIDRGDQHLADINLQLTEKEKQIKDVAAEIQELRKRNINLENMLSQIADKEASAASHAQRLQQCVKLMRAKYEVCRNELIAKNAAQDELVRMMVVPDWETLHGRVRQLIDLERRHVELNEMYRGMLKELDELSAKHDKLTHSHVEFVKRTEIELERKNAQLMAFEKHNNHFDCFLTRIFTLLRSRNGPKSTTMCSANTSIESMRIEQRFENIEKLIEGQLLSADTLKKELDDLRAKNEELSTENINAIIKRKKFVDSLEVNSEKVKQYITDLEKEAFSKNEKVAQLENTLSEEQSNARQLALRLDMAQQEVNDYYVEATRFINTVMDRIHEDFNGENHPQTLGNCMTKFLRIFDQMEVWYEDSSSLVEKLLHTRDELKKKLKASDEKMAKVMETYEEQIKALQAECDMEAKKNEHLEANRNAVMDTKDRRCQNFDKQDSSTDELFSVQGKLQKEQEITAQLKEDTLEKLQAKLQEGQQLVDSQKVELDKERKELAQVKSAFETQIKLSDDLQREKESAQQLVDSQKVELDKERKELAQVKSAFETQTKLSDDLQREKESAQQLVDNLKVELDKGQKELAQVKTAFEAQTKLSDDLQREKESAQQLVDNLKVELDKGQKELAQVKTAFEAQTKLSDDLQREKESAQQLVDNLKVELDKERKELAQVKSAFETQIKLSDDLQRENESAQRLVDNLKVELDKGQKELAQVKTAFEAQTKLSDDLQREKESAQQLVDSQKVELDKERKELAQVKSAFETQIKLSDDLQRENESAQRLVDNLKVELDKGQKELAQVKTAFEAQTKISDDLQREKESAQQLVDNLKVELDKERKELAQVKSAFETQIKLSHDLQRENESAQRLVDNLKVELDKGQKELAQVKSAFETQTKLSDDLQREKESAQQLVDNLKVELDKERKELAQVKSAFETQIKLSDDLQREKESAQQLVDNLKVELDKGQKELAQVKTAFEAQTKLSDDLQREKESAQREIFLVKERLRKEKREFEVELATLEDMIETLEEGRTQMEAERAAAYERINQLEARCQENNNANSELQVQTFKLECLQHQLKSEVGSCNSLVEDLNRKLADNVSKLDDAQSRLKTEIDEHNQVKEQLAHIADIPEVVELRNCLEAVTAQREEAQEKLAVVTSLLGRSNQEKLKMEEKACEVGNKNAELLELVEFYRYRVEAIERLLLASNQELEELKTNQAEGARDLGDTYSTSDGRQTETDQDKERNNKLALDCKILQAKYRDAKDEIKRCEKKIKDQRLEMEGKLEKMKNKMDGPHSLDDSMSALLSSSSTGTRKKSMGTHYKRPGPPTPSKNGGRLSFGSSEPPREILREFGDHNNTSKTPARFKFLTQRFSVGSSGLPRDELPRRKRPNLLTGTHRRRLRHAVDIFCTSTPRKSRSYYDQQRLIGASDAEKSEAVETEDEVIEVEPDAVPELEPLEDADQEGTPHLSTAALLALTKGNTRRLTGTTKPKKRRVSLSNHGNIFAKSRPASFVAGKRVQLRRKLRRDRMMGRFDEARHLDQVRLSHSVQAPESPENNNYSLHNRNEEEHLPSEILMGKTVVLVGKSRVSPVVSTTFNVEERSGTSLLQQQFEHENCVTWATHGSESVMMEETQNDWYFEQLCQETESTAPFQLQPLEYKPLDEEPAEPKLTQLVAASCSNITANSCATNMTGASSCTVYSMGSVHMQPLPQINITYVQQPPDSQQRRPARHRSLMAQCRRFLRHLSLGERLVMGFALLVMVGLSLHLADKLVLVISGILSGMGLVFLTYSCPGRN
ncbi:early endosome antigen 1 isoform X4 [Drosophila mauritiana]|uniref:Early endosome antigen 1 isoform X4 n=1 Tax=Drosophila mauritiana TaxID=7226 RepID=A0A6P8KIB1_DROMA|nr:early endosome antigen 1 isoform X4 [Drosophila mauritiana]